jgi:transcriptional regulator GlxA family with amidase domain
MGVLFFLALSANVALVRFNPRMQFVGIAKPIKESSDDPILSQLLKRMQNERLYADHDLRIGRLADIVGLPEYQLRKKINQDLGYRNFNQFVNRFRIMEAGSRLLANQRVPILTIALDVGFRSMSAFNAAFHSHYQLNPTEYRLRSLSDL